MSIKCMVTLLLVAVIQDHRVDCGQELKSQNVNTTRSLISRNVTTIQEDQMDDSSPYVEQQEHAGMRGKTKVIMFKNKYHNRKKIQTNVQSQTNNNKNNNQNSQINNNKNNNQNSQTNSTKNNNQKFQTNNNRNNNPHKNIGKAEKFFLPKNNKINSQMQIGQRVVDNRKVLGFLSKPIIGTGIGGVNQPIGEIAIALPKRMKHLNIGIIRRPKNRGGGRGTVTKVPPDSPEYPEFYEDQPTSDLPPAPGSILPEPSIPVPPNPGPPTPGEPIAYPDDTTNGGNDYSNDYGTGI